MGSWQFTVFPTGQRLNGIRLIVVKQYLLVILVIVFYALLVADVVAVGRRGADRWLAVLSDSHGERGQPHPSPAAGSSPAPDAPLPLSGSPQRKRRNGVARDAHCAQGQARAKENAGLRVGERRSYARVSCLIRGCAGDEEPTHARQGNLRRNAKRPARDLVAAGRSVLILRLRCRCSTATPQLRPRGRSGRSAPVAGSRDGEACQPLRGRVRRVAHSGKPCLF